MRWHGSRSRPGNQVPGAGSCAAPDARPGGVPGPYQSSQPPDSLGCCRGICVGEIQSQGVDSTAVTGVEMCAGEEGDPFREGQVQERPGVALQRGIELQPEEQAARRHLPAGEIAEVPVQQPLEVFSPGAIDRPQSPQPLLRFFPLQAFQHQVLADAVAVQVGGLLEDGQVGQQVG